MQKHFTPKDFTQIYGTIFWKLFFSFKKPIFLNVDCFLGNELHSDITNTQSCPSFKLAFKTYFYANMFLEKKLSIGSKEYTKELKF